MRFNSRELAQLAQQAANVDKEGVLYMKEKPESIFKTKEVYIDRFFRLKGNLLFFFKNKETRSEPLGVLVIERCTVELDLEEDAPNSFVLVCEGEDNPFKFAAISEEERDGWIQALHMASYECLKMQLQSLREQVQAKTGRDPVTMPDSSSSGLDLDIQTDTASEDPVLEISLSCSDLPCDSQGTAPNSLVLVHIIVPQQQQLWVHHNHTEISDKNSNPLFLKTIGFGDVNGVDTSTRVRLTVYNVKERMTGTMAQLGQAIFTLQDVLMTPDLTLTLTLQSHDVKSRATVTMMAWINDNKVSLADLKRSSSPTQTGSLPVDQTVSTRTLSTAYVRNSLRTHFSNVIKRSFRFATNTESISLQVHEYMSEFQHSFDIAVQLLRIWIDEEKQKNSLLQDLGELWAEWEAPQIAWITLAARTAEHYTNSLDTLIEYKGSSFKCSKDKDRVDLEFVTVNLHLQRMAVSSDNPTSPGVMYDILTMGAPTAFGKKYKNGGLRRMLHQQRTTHTAESTLGPRTKLQRACSLRNEATDLRADIIKHCEQLSDALTKSVPTGDLQAAVEHLTKKARELIGLCEDPVLCSAADMYVLAKRQGGGDGQDTASSLTAANSTAPPPPPPQNSHRWSGSNFVKSPTTEPWEVTRLNLEAAVVCLLSLMEGMSSDSGNNTDIRPTDIQDGVAKLQTFVDLVSAKISLFLTFLTIMENKDSIQKMHEIKYRRDIVNSHAITSLVSGVCAMVEHQDFTTPRRMQQLQHCGLLVQWEGLLSCYGEELGMIEDMAVAVDDLRFVTFKFVSVESEGDADPTVHMGSHVKDGPYPDFNRHTLCVHIPVQEHIFQQLPTPIQQGQEITVCPIFFNIGINEEAAYAETRFGSTAVQEHINAQSVSRLHSYYDQMTSVFNDQAEKVGGPGSVGHLLKLLNTNVVGIKKSKNVEILHLASEICQRLNGVRVTACKSGKDRTSMGVTLEMIQLLQRHHDLAPHVFTQALDCIRSVGCRRENTYKNTGVRKYAFNRFQMLYIPKQYRAPGGTYGNIIT